MSEFKQKIPREHGIIEANKELAWLLLFISLVSKLQLGNQFYTIDFGSAASRTKHHQQQLPPEAADSPCGPGVQSNRPKWRDWSPKTWKCWA